MNKLTKGLKNLSKLTLDNIIPDSSFELPNPINLTNGLKDLSRVIVHKPQLEQEPELVNDTNINLTTIMREYIFKMLSSVDGLKILVIDQETTHFISTIYSMSEIVELGVTLIHQIDTFNENILNKLSNKKINSKKTSVNKVVFFLRPTEENIAYLIPVLKLESGCEYHVFFSNMIKQEYVQFLSQSDKHRMIKQIQIFFCDVFVSCSKLFNLNTKKCSEERIVSALESIMLSTKRKYAIRYCNNSGSAKNIANKLSDKIRTSGDLFHFGATEPRSLLLILDRRNDPITPIIKSWTYGAMINELLPDIKLITSQDEFYETNIWNNYGELCGNVKKLVDQYQSLQKKLDPNTTKSLDEMVKIKDKLPEFNRMSNVVKTHLTIMDNLSNIIKSRKLYEISEIEQLIASGSRNYSAVQQDVENILKDPLVDINDKINLVILLQLKFNRLDKINELVSKFISDKNKVNELNQLIDKIKKDTNIYSKSKLFKDETNVLSLYKPAVIDIISDISKLDINNYPYSYGSSAKWELIVIYIIGGVTYQEMSEIKNMKRYADIIIGGDSILDSGSFIDLFR